MVRGARRDIKKAHSHVCSLWNVNDTPFSSFCCTAARVVCRHSCQMLSNEALPAHLTQGALPLAMPALTLHAGTPPTRITLLYMGKGVYQTKLVHTVGMRPAYLSFYGLPTVLHAFRYVMYCVAARAQSCLNKVGKAVASIVQTIFASACMGPE